MFKSIKFFHSNVVDDCFDKEQSYPDAIAEVLPLTSDGKCLTSSTTASTTTQASNTRNSSFLVHRMILSSKNQVLRHLFQNTNVTMMTTSTHSSTPVTPRSYHHRDSSTRAKIQLGFSCSAIPISAHHQKECIQSLLSFYYTGKVELNQREHLSSLLLLAHLYFAPEIVLSLVHYLDCTLLKHSKDFTLSDCLNILSLFHTSSEKPCQHTIISSIDPLYENAILNQQQQTLSSDFAVFSKHLVQNNNHYQPFKFTEWTSSTNSSFPSFTEKYGGGQTIWKEHAQNLREKALQFLFSNFSQCATHSEFLNLQFERMQSIILDVAHHAVVVTEQRDMTSQLLQVILNWLNFNYEHRIQQAPQLFSLLQILVEKQQQDSPLNVLKLSSSAAEWPTSTCSNNIEINTPSSIKHLTCSNPIQQHEQQQQPEIYTLHIQSATPPQKSTSHEQTSSEKSITPEIQTTTTRHPFKMSSFLGIDMEETHSTSTPPTSPVVALIASDEYGSSSSSSNASSRNNSTLNSPTHMMSEPYSTTSSTKESMIPTISTSNIMTRAVTTTTTPTITTTTLNHTLAPNLSTHHQPHNNNKYSLTPNFNSSNHPHPSIRTTSPNHHDSDSGGTSTRISRSHSAFVRPHKEQEKGTFGHLKRLATPFKFTFTERDDEKEKSPPKTIFEVEEESLSDWQEVGKIVTVVPVKKVEQVLVKREDK
ncbi:hypothetical protein C9374_007956 [Naegleria lovaniensis]|uniref:BTB domain-containing protein n=1 Tax=Naegleria lovaniensis TaxID=51637 RepID=A0AA88KIE6_NAELO|nr:uncharacterized protein C9374_007956 [Naegleria lovaniensis]KAG2378808.1 hypothetical protein C9374_007956 [Naegleria lovaniensis]